MATNSTASPSLLVLLPSNSYLLPYAVPLLLLSLVLTFSGTFLTLDRTRSFPPTSPSYSTLPSFDGHPKQKRFRWLFEGGVGGTASGFLFGLHFSTMLCLLIPATTTSAQLTQKSFLAIWLISCTITTLLASRFRLAALLFTSLSGGTLLALSTSILLHPALLTRIILVSISSSIFPLLVLSTLLSPRIAQRLLHPTMRACTASTGAFGVVVAIALLANPKVEGWANAWERLWMKDGMEWGSAKEKGLSAACCIFLFLGVVCDWLLKRWVGECPDEKWDNYLANYATGLPSLPDRAGSFQPLASFWDRIFPPTTPPLLPNPHPPHHLLDEKEKFIAFPLNTQTDLQKPKSHHASLVSDHEIPNGGAGLLKKKKTATGWRALHNLERRKRREIKFGEGGLTSDSESESDGESVPWAVPSLSYGHASETTTLVDGKDAKPTKKVAVDVDYDKEMGELRKARGLALVGGMDEEVIYSDWEEDVTNGGMVRNSNPNSTTALLSTPAPARPAASRQISTHPPQPEPQPVPATPSLIKALDRIAVAQRDAFGPAAASNIPPPSLGARAYTMPLPIYVGGSSPNSPSTRAPISPSSASPPIVSASSRTPVRTVSAQPGLVRKLTASFEAKAKDVVENKTDAGVGERGKPKRRSTEPLPSHQREEVDDEDEDMEDMEAGIITSAEKHRAPRWEEFWREVRSKAQS